VRYGKIFKVSCGGNQMNTLLELLNAQMKRPSLYGGLGDSWFQYFSMVIFIVLMVLLTKKYFHADDQQLKKFLRLTAIVLIIFEVYKQLIFSYRSDWTYQWYSFPFQFCSTPMYVALIASFLKPTRFREALYMFLATYGLFAGFAVMLYPVSVYTTTIGINIQTMVHHGGMAMMGMVLLSNHVKLKFSSFLLGSYVFVTLTFIAIMLNGIHNTWIQEGTFNMFFVNPLYNSEIPVLSLFQPLVPSSIYVLIFLFGFTLIGYLMIVFKRLFDAVPQFQSKKVVIKN
jgi:hypothetical protein